MPLSGVAAYALSKKAVASVAAGIDHYEVDGQDLVIKPIEGEELRISFSVPSKGVSITDVVLNADNSFTISFSDGTTTTTAPVNVSAATYAETDNDAGGKTATISGN